MHGDVLHAALLSAFLYFAPMMRRCAGGLPPDSHKEALHERSAPRLLTKSA